MGHVTNWDANWTSNPPLATRRLKNLLPNDVLGMNLSPERLGNYFLRKDVLETMLLEVKEMEGEMELLQEKRIKKEKVLEDEDEDEEEDEEDEDEDEEEDRKGKLVLINDMVKRMTVMNEKLNEDRDVRDSWMIKLKEKKWLELFLRLNKKKWLKQMRMLEVKKRLKERMRLEKKKTMEVEENPRIKFRKGQKYNILDILSSGERDYLITNMGNQRIKVNIQECLSGKYLLLYFWGLSDRCTPDRTDTFLNVDLRLIYHTYHYKGMFEVVFVALGDNKNVFDKVFSKMQWFAIPHEDKEARHKFDIAPIPLAWTVLFDPDGTVILEQADAHLAIYGRQGFPFTKERLSQINNESRAIWNELVLGKTKLSYTALFGEHVVSPEGRVVPTSELQGKILGLYFFEASDKGYAQATKLLEISELLKKDKKYENFEIVFMNKDDINIASAKGLFKDKFKRTIPWYSIFLDSRPLCRIFRNDWLWLPEDACVFVILKPDQYQSFNYFGFEIMEVYGIDAYPFTMERAVALAKREQKKKLVLSELLLPTTPLIRGGPAYPKDKTTVSQLLLSGKQVLLLFTTKSCYLSEPSFLRALKRMYLEKKGADANFEIIYISCDGSRSSLAVKFFKELPPWLVVNVFGFGLSLAQKVFDIFPPQLPAVAAFGSNGRLQAKESNLADKKKWNNKYPFIQGFGGEVHRELIHKFKWDMSFFDSYMK